MEKGTYKRTPMVRAKQRASLKGRKRAPFSEETRRRMSVAMRGNKNGRGLIGTKKTEEHKKKISSSLMGHAAPVGEKAFNWRGGKPNCIDCGVQTLYRKRCRPCYLEFNVGENHPSWLGVGRKYPREFNANLKRKIRERDGYVCCLCGRSEREELEELNQVLCVNHIDFNKENCSESNLNTLCLRCNVKINRERDYWTNYFNQRMI